MSFDRQDAGSMIPKPGSWILDAVSWILGPGSSVSVSSIHIYTYIHKLDRYICVYTCIYIYIYMYICIYVFMYKCIYVYVYICICAYMFIYVYICVYMCI